MTIIHSYAYTFSFFSLISSINIYIYICIISVLSFKLYFINIKLSLISVHQADSEEIVARMRHLLYILRINDPVRNLFRDSLLILQLSIKQRPRPGLMYSRTSPWTLVIFYARHVRSASCFIRSFRWRFSGFLALPHTFELDHRSSESRRGRSPKFLRAFKFHGGWYFIHTVGNGVPCRQFASLYI